MLGEFYFFFGQKKKGEFFFLDLLIPFNLQTLSLSGMMIFIGVYFQG